MTTSNWKSLKEPFQNWKQYAQNNQPELKRLLLVTTVFLGFMMLFSLHRYFTYYASYDHGLFNQLFWNNLHGNFFQSSLTSPNTAAVLLDGKIPVVNFVHLGQHFVPNFLLWLPIYALFPHPATLVMLQVLLMTAGGLVLYALARHYLQPQLSLWITAGYFCANAVIGPTFANFYEHCQIPLFTFSMLLALEKQRWGLFWLFTALVLGIREDTCIFLFGIGLYLLWSRRHPRVGLALCILSCAYLAIITNVVMAHFSDDVSRQYMSNRFQQFVPDTESPNTLQVFWGILTHPLEVVKSLLLPFDRRFFYLVGQWIPLAFVPSLSPASWTIAGFPLLSLFLQSGKTALGITIRYAVAVVPGMFYGGILWWAYRSKRPPTPLPEAGDSWFKQVAWAYRNREFTPAFRQFWKICLVLSVISAIACNPNQAFYFLVPDSINPWVLVPLHRQWERTAIMNSMVSTVPPDASVSATTHIIPHLSTRRKIIRLPGLELRNEQGQVEQMEYLMGDLWRLQQYMPAFKNDRDRLQSIIAKIDEILANRSYGLLDVRAGIVFLKKGVESNPVALAAWAPLRQDLLASIEDLMKRQKNKK